MKHGRSSTWIIQGIALDNSVPRHVPSSWPLRHIEDRNLVLFRIRLSQISMRNFQDSE